MEPRVADRVKETTVTSGVGPLALDGASVGFQSFATGVGVGQNGYYSIVHRTLPQWEVGIGRTISAAQLNRVTVLASSNAGALVDFSAGTKDVFSTVPAMLFDQQPLRVGAGRLGFVDTTHVKLIPFNGNKLPVKDAVFGWRMRDIPAAGILSAACNAAANFVGGVANQILTNGTYDVFVFDNAGALTFDFRLTPGGVHSADATTGIEVLTGANGDLRTFVGKVGIDPGGLYQDNLARRFVRSYYNRVPMQLYRFIGADRVTSSAVLIEINSADRVDGIAFADELMTFTYLAAGKASAALPGRLMNALFQDGAQVSQNPLVSCTNHANMGFSTQFLPQEGYHEWHVCHGVIDGGTGTWLNPHEFTGRIG